MLDRPPVKKSKNTADMAYAVANKELFNPKRCGYTCFNCFSCDNNLLFFSCSKPLEYTMKSYCRALGDQYKVINSSSVNRMSQTSLLLAGTVKGILYSLDSCQDQLEKLQLASPELDSGAEDVKKVVTVETTPPANTAKFECAVENYLAKTYVAKSQRNPKTMHKVFALEAKRAGKEEKLMKQKVAPSTDMDAAMKLILECQKEIATLNATVLSLTTENVTLVAKVEALTMDCKLFRTALTKSDMLEKIYEPSHDKTDCNCAMCTVHIEGCLCTGCVRFMAKFRLTSRPLDTDASRRANEWRKAVDSATVAEQKAKLEDEYEESDDSS
jgi:hypothetical protein